MLWLVLGYVAVILGIFFVDLWIKNRIEAKEKSEPAQSGKQNARFSQVVRELLPPLTAPQG